IDRGGGHADAEIALVRRHGFAVEGHEIVAARGDHRAGIGNDAGFLQQFAPGRVGPVLARIAFAARRGPEWAAAFGRKAEQQQPVIGIEQQEARRPADAPRRGGCRHSPGARALMASAWTRCPGRSPSARLTMRWRSSRETPAKAALSISTVKCDSPDPSCPAWPWWSASSLITASRSGRKASFSLSSISCAIGPVMSSVLARQAPCESPMRQDKFHGRVHNAGRLCNAPGCDQPGEFRAPGVRASSFDGPG
ncbi:hypothetical protein OY671_008739, partial [Metschnikowia pulcherrima]